MKKSQSCVVSLIGNPKQEALPPALVMDIQKRLKRLVESSKVEWLGEREACEIHCVTDELSAVRIEMRSLMQDKPFDFAMLAPRGRKKKLLISDMDSTMIAQECIDELADHMGIKEQVAAITEAAMRGEVEFKQALIQRVALLKGLQESVLQEVYNHRITLMPGAKTLLATMKANGAKTLLVSGGFTFFTQQVAQELGFDGEMANILEIDQAQLTGRVMPPILDKDSKLRALQHVAKAYAIQVEETLAVGDGANDLPMVEAAGMGIAFRAKDILKRGATAAIDHCDLTALLYLQGYTKSEFKIAE
ncbi:MAG: phosphoserine phosphatase SerB [Rickettsiales bacterium]|nr:phosphoserine phosphatase SerB [Rickettsiales bacterium]